MKKLLAILLSVLVIVAYMPAVAFAEEGDSANPKTGRTITKETTQIELNAWAGENAIKIETVDDTTIVTLLKDFKLGKLGGHINAATNPIEFGECTEGKCTEYKMVLDLNGHSLESDTIVIQSECDLTIKDSQGTGGPGKVSMDTSGFYEAVVNQYKLTIEGGTFEAHHNNSISGVVGSAIPDVVTTINGGTFTGSGSAIYVSSGTTTINGGTFTGGYYGIVARGTAEVNVPAESKAEVTSSKFPIVVGGTGMVNIEGGEFKGTDPDTNLVGKMEGANAQEAVTIEGGTFAQDPTAYVGDKPVAQVGDPFIVGAEQIQDKAKDATDEKRIDVKKGAINLTNIPAGVTVKNSGEGSVTVNDVAVESNNVNTNCKEHEWDITYNWKADNTVCIAERTCKKGCGYKETANAISKKSTTEPATCIKKGKVTYTAKFVVDGNWADIQTVEKESPMTSHNYGSDGKCTVCGQSKPSTGGGGYYDPLNSDRNEGTGAIEDAAKANAYDKEEQAVIDEIVANAKSDIRKATTKEEIAKIKEDALKAIDEVMTSEEKKAAEEIANLKKVVGSTAIQLKSKKTEGAVRLYWTVNTGVKLDGYDVYRSKVKSEVKNHRWGGTTKTTYKNAKALKKGTRYNYKVRGYKIVNGEKVYTKWSNLNWRIAI